MGTYFRMAMTARNWRRLKSSSSPRRDIDATYRQILQLEQRTLANSDSVNLGSNPSSPARFKSLRALPNSISNKLKLPKFRLRGVTKLYQAFSAAYQGPRIFHGT